MNLTLKRILAGLFVLGFLAALPARAAEPTLDEKVESAIKRATSFLLGRKRGDNWEYDAKWWDRSFKGGETALVLYTLLHAGQSMDDARLKANSSELQPVVKWLCAQQPDTTYGAAFRASALSMVAYLKQPEVRKALEQDKTYLMASMRPDGGYTYSLAELRRHQQLALQQKNATDIAWDNSNAQYALLAMWAIHEAGIETRVDYWKLCDRYWRLKQRQDGGWAYDNQYRKESFYTMNIAGLASLYVTGDFVGYQRRDPAFAAAWTAIERDFRPDRDDYYYMYGVERVGLATGMKFIGSTNWYRAIAAHMIRRQAAEGYWRYHDGVQGDGGESEIVATCYALLFLARGRNPVVFNKLAYGGPDATWDTHPRDNANITHWMSKTFERPLNWQVVNTRVDPEEWLDAPVLLITGTGDPKFSAEEVEKIKKYIYAGGIVLSVADSGNLAFTNAIRRVYAPAATDKKYEMHEVPREHPIFSEKLWGKVRNPPKMLAMSNGVRDVWFHSEADLGATWHHRRQATVDHWTLAANLHFYATGRGTLRNKLQSVAVQPSPEPTTRQIRLARLDYSGNPDPEPGAWPRMAKLAQAKFHTNLQLSTVRAVDLKDFSVAHMTGTTRFTLPDKDVAALKAFLTAGGVLLADSAGGSNDFTTSFLALLKQVVPDGAPEAIPQNDRLYSGNIADAVKIDTVRFRRGTAATEKKPRLLGVQKDGRWVVLFSPDDITAGLLGTHTWGILGYHPDHAQDLARNMLLYSQK